MLRCAHAMYHYIAFCAGFQAGFFIISCLAAKWLECGGRFVFTPCKPAAQLHIGNGMGLGTEAESPNVRWGSGGKDGSLR